MLELPSTQLLTVWIVSGPAVSKQYIGTIDYMLLANLAGVFV